MTDVKLGTPVLNKTLKRFEKCVILEFYAVALCSASYSTDWMHPGMVLDNSSMHNKYQEFMCLSIIVLGIVTVSNKCQVLEYSTLCV